MSEAAGQIIDPNAVVEWVTRSNHNCAIMLDGTIAFRRQSGASWIVQLLPDLCIRRFGNVCTFMRIMRGR